MENHLSEILFFSLMICVTVLGDLSDVVKPFGRGSLLYIILMSFVFGAVFSAVLYGAFLFDLLIGTNIAVFRTRLMWVSIGVAIILFLAGTATEVFLARIVPEGDG